MMRFCDNIHREIWESKYWSHNNLRVSESKYTNGPKQDNKIGILLSIVFRIRFTSR